MREKLLALYEIQKMDVQIREIDAALGGVAGNLEVLDGEVKLLEEQKQTLTTEADNLDREARTLEGTVHAESDKVRKWEKRLNDIRNQREYMALSREIEASRRQNRDTEEKILELLSRREAIDGEVEALDAKTAEKQTERAEEAASVDKSTSEHRAKLDTATARRDELLNAVPASLLKKYDSIRAKRAQIGLVATLDGTCSGCNMRLPPQLYNMLQRGDSIEQCPSCQRIVFWAGFYPRSPRKWL